MSKDKQNKIEISSYRNAVAAIIKKQSLPKDVVLKFLAAKGKLIRNKKGKFDIA